jgi:O-antigen ligase
MVSQSALALGLMVLGVLALIGVVFAVPAPALLLATIALMPISNYLLIPLPNGLGEATVWKGMLGLCAISYFVQGRVNNWFRPRRAEAFLGAFVAFAIVSSALSVDPATSLRIGAALPLLLMLAVLTAAYVRSDSGNLGRILEFSTSIGAVFAALGLIGFGLYLLTRNPSTPGVSISGDGVNFFIVRLVSVGGDANVFGSYLAWTTPIAVGQATTRGGWWRWVRVVVLLAAGILTFSRGTWVSLFIAVPLAILLTTRKRVPYLGAVALVTIALAVTLAASSTIRDIVQERFNSASVTFAESSESRLAIWEAAARETFSEPKSALIGLGQGAISDWVKYGILSLDRRGRIGVLHAHDVFFELLASSGVIGLFIFLLAVRSLVVQALASVRTGRPEVLVASLGLVGALLSGLSIMILLSPWLWLSLGLLAVDVGPGRDPIFRETNA